MTRITSRFVFLIAAAAVAPLVTYGAVSVMTLRSATEQSVREGNLRVARQVAQQIKQYVVHNQRVLKSLGLEMRGVQLATWQQERILRDYALDFPELREISLFTAAGEVVATSRVTGATLSIGSLVGFVTLFGIVARNAILMIAHVNHLMGVERAQWSLETVLRGARERLVPILMTALVTALGLLPLAAASGETGREVEGPMAAVILGGLATSTIMNLLVLPVLIWRFGPMGSEPRAARAGATARDVR